MAATAVVAEERDNLHREHESFKRWCREKRKATTIMPHFRHVHSEDPQGVLFYTQVHEVFHHGQHHEERAMLPDSLVSLSPLPKPSTDIMKD